MGVDVHYSGTVSAAFEAVILGVPGDRCLAGARRGVLLRRGGSTSRAVWRRWVLRNGLPDETLLNVNVPSGPAAGVRLTRLGERRYTEGVVEDTDPRGRRCYWIGGGHRCGRTIPGTDFTRSAPGYVSVTPLHLDMTDTGPRPAAGRRAPGSTGSGT